MIELEPEGKKEITIKTMKTDIEIKQEVKQLQRRMNLIFEEKRSAKEESTTMRQIDNEIDKLGAKIKSLQWVLN
jgi:hypothetical protein